MTDTAMPGDAAFREALEFMGDPNRLLPGEEPGTRYADDARHWLNVYAELLHFKDELLAAVRRASGRVRRPARAEVHTDLALMEAERSRLHSRTEFWRQKLNELSRS